MGAHRILDHIAARACARDHEPHRRVTVTPRGHDRLHGTGDLVDALLLADVAAVQGDDGVRRDTDLGAERRPVRIRPDALGVDPIGKFDDPLRRDPLARQPVGHARRDRRDRVEPAQQPAFTRLHRAGDGLRQKMQIERGIEFEILDMQPGQRAPEPRRGQSRRRDKRRRLHHEDHIRAPEHARPFRRRRTGQGETREMQNPPQAGRPARDIERAAHHPHAVHDFPPPPPFRIAGRDLPGRVIGGCGDRAHAMSACGEPGRHVAREPADAGHLGGEIQTVDKNFHEAIFFGAIIGSAGLCSPRTWASPGRSVP